MEPMQPTVDEIADGIHRISTWIPDVSPEGFTHGTSAQRVAWFRRGLESGDPNACDTFAQTRP